MEDHGRYLHDRPVGKRKGEEEKQKKKKNKNFPVILLNH